MAPKSPETHYRTDTYAAAILRVAVFVSALASPQPVGAFALIPNAPTGGVWVTNILTHPNNYLSWDKGSFGNPILYGFTPAFLAAFPDAKQREQVHLAMNEWSAASIDGARRAPGALYRWDRLSPGPPAFYDLRSLVTHEIGHVLGSQHPDAAWFNGAPPYERNYVPNGGGGYVATPPIGGEIMNEGNGPGLPVSKPAKGLNQGEYWRHLSKDELWLIDYVYPGGIFFQFTNNVAAADIVFENFANDDCSGAIGAAGPDSTTDRDNGDANQGGIINDATVFIHEVCDNQGGVPVGFAARADYWEVTNDTGQNALSLLVTTEGTDNDIPTDEFSVGANRFTKYTNFPGDDPTSSLEGILHQWTHPMGGVVPPAGSVDVMLQQDVWDWVVTDARLLMEDLTTCPVPLVEVSPFLDPQILPPVPDPGDGDEVDGLVGLPPEPSPLKTFRVANLSTERTTLSEILFVDLDDLPPLEPDAYPGAVDDAIAKGRAHSAVGSGPGQLPPLVLSPGDEFHIVIEGTTGDLLAALPDVVASGSFHFFPIPQLADGPYLAWTNGNNSCASAGGITQINPVIVVPEPGALASFFGGTLLLGQLARRRRQRAAR